MMRLSFRQASLGIAVTLVLVACKAQDATNPTDSTSAAFTSVSTGWDHSCGVRSTNKGYCWGANGLGQLGDGTTSTDFKPRAVAGSQLFTFIAAGNGVSCGLTTTQAAFCWGSIGLYPMLGDGSTASGTMRSTPTAVSGGLSFKALAAGISRVCALTTAGAAYCWGGGAPYSLGDGTTSSRAVPTVVSGGNVFAGITVGTDHACGWTAAGAAFCWGRNTEFQLGDGTATNRSTPVAVSGGLTFAKLMAAGFVTCGITTGGATYCWGTNTANGRIGDGTTTDRPVPTLVTGGRTFTSLAGTGLNTCGLQSDGQMFCWGNNQFGAFGNGTTTQNNVVPTAGAGTTRFSAIGAGSASQSTICGVTLEGSTVCMGKNTDGQVGDGTNTSPRTTPTALAP